jgi:hypothetical protein
LHSPIIPRTKLNCHSALKKIDREEEAMKKQYLKILWDERINQESGENLQ